MMLSGVVHGAHDAQPGADVKAAGLVSIPPWAEPFTTWSSEEGQLC